MIKQNKSFVAISLGIALSSQNLMLISNAQSLKSSSDGTMSIYSNNDLKINKDIENPETNSQEVLDENSEQTPDENSLNDIDSTDLQKPDTNSEEIPEEDPLDNINNTNLEKFNTNSEKVPNENPLKVMNLSNSNAIGSGSVTSDALNVRSGPSNSDDIIGALSINETVEILDKANYWFKIDYNGQEGYISSAYLKLNPIEKGIDVSKWNGSIDWTSVKNSGVDYVIIRAGYGTSTVDPQFRTYIEGARNAGLKIGVYWFSYATSVDKAVIEAQKCLETISPYKDSITYPVFFDFEYDSVKYANNNGVTVTKNSVTQMANAFINKVRSQGYTTGVYTNKDFSSKYYTDDIIDSNNLWVAQYSSTNTFGRPYSMWQYSEKGSVPGISGYVDLNYTCLKTFANNGGSGGDIEIPTGPNTEKGVTTANLNLRNSASTSSSIITTIPNGSAINIIDKSNPDWYKVEYKGATGYVSTEYVKLDSSDSGNDDNTPSVPTTQKGVTTANLNLRNSASTSSSIIRTIPSGSTIEIVSKYNSSWYKVKHNGTVGYVSTEYVKLNDGSTPSVPTTQKGVTTFNLNLRKSSSTSSSIITTIPGGTTIEIVSKASSGWYKVKYKSYTGYVVGNYLKL